MKNKTLRTSFSLAEIKKNSLQLIATCIHGSKQLTDQINRPSSNISWWVYKISVSIDFVQTQSD